MNYVLFNQYGELTKKHVRGVVATSNLADKVYIFFELDVSTEETAFRCEARTKRADGLRTKSILTLTVYGFDTENEALVFGTPTYNEVSEKWEVPCRELTLTDEMLGANGDLEVTISYQTVNELGAVTETNAQAIFIIKVFEAVEPTYDDEDEQTLLALLLLRDLSDVTDGGVVGDTDVFLGRQSGVTKKIVATAIKAYCVDDIISGTQTLDEVNVTGDVNVGNDVNATRDVNITRNLNVTGTIDAKTNKIVNVATPTENGDGANKLYVDTREAVVQDDLDGYKEDLADGTITVNKATNDKDGNAIDTTYLKKSGGVMSGEISMGTTNRITAMADGAQDQDAATLANVDTKISAHNISETAHLFIRELIADVKSEVDRVESRGKSYGELALLQSELLALSEEARNTAIYNDIIGRYPSYVLADNQLVYTKEDDEENTHEWEYNGTLETWVDNGAWIVSKASNVVYGKVKGDGTYLSIVSGIVQVLLSDYATKLGEDGTSYTYQQIYDALANRYTKSEVDDLINAIKQLYELETTYTNDLVTTNYVATESISDADFLVLEFISVDTGVNYTQTQIVKNATAKGSSNYNGFNMSFSTSNGATATLVYSEAVSTELLFTVTNSQGTETLKVTAYKMKAITADVVVYDNADSGLTATDLKGAIDELADEKEDVANLVTAFQETPDDTHYASEKLIKDSLDLKVDKENIKSALSEETSDENVLSEKYVDDRVTLIESDVVVLEHKAIDSEKRIDTLEESVRKHNSDVASADDDGIGIISLGKDVAETPITAKIDGLLLDAPQLVTNGDFSDGTTGWSSVTYNSLTVENGVGKLNVLQLGTSGNSTVGLNEITSISKYYYSYEIKPKYSNETRIIIGGISDYSPTLNPNVWNKVSNVITTISESSITRIGHLTTTSYAIGDFWYIDNYMRFNISTLITNKQYSPLYATTFDLMSDAQIKAQMDLWVQTKTLPNSVMAVDMNKRLRSVGKNLFDKSLYATSYAYKIPIKPSTAYHWETSTAFKTYDISGVEIGGATATNETTESNAYYIAFSGIANVDTFQLEYASATTYAPYRSTDLYLKGNEKGYSFEDTKDSIEFRNGKAYFINRINDTQDGLRATPIETEIATIGNAYAYPNGTIYIDDITTSSGKYSTSIAVNDTDYPIKTLTKVIKLNSDGSQTVLVASSGVVAENGLSFTHTDLTANDFVWFEYEYTGTNVKGLSTVYYYDNPMIITDSVDEKVYKIKFTIADGVITVGKDEV